MRFVTLKTGENLAGLARRLYGASTSRARLEQAEEALAAANPHLAGRKGAPADAIALVPDIPGVVAKEGTSPGTVAAAVLRRVHENTDTLRAALAQRADTREERAKAALAQLASAEVKRVGKSERELGRQLPGLTKAAKARLQGVKELRKLSQEAVAALEQDLNDLIRSLG